MSLTLDFDQFEQEAQEATLTVKNLLGRDWELPGPGQLPARVVAWQQRTAMTLMREARERGIDLADPNAEIPDDLVAKLVESDAEEYVVAGMVGQENLDEMYRLGIKEWQLDKLIAWAQEQHMLGRTENAEDEGSEGEADDHPTVASKD